jgi:hypothetical protein
MKCGPAVGPSKSPLQWAPRAISPEVKLPEREADYPHPSSDDVHNTRNLLPPLHSLQGVLLNETQKHLYISEVLAASIIISLYYVLFIWQLNKTNWTAVWIDRAPSGGGTSTLGTCFVLWTYSRAWASPFSFHFRFSSGLSPPRNSATCLLVVRPRRVYSS